MGALNSAPFGAEFKFLRFKESQFKFFHSGMTTVSLMMRSKKLEKKIRKEGKNARREIFFESC